MKNPHKILLSVLLASTLAAPARAAAPAPGTKAPTTQQQRMKDCNAGAKAQGLKKDARRAFMSGCLRGETPAAAAGGATDQQAARKQ